MSYQVLARKWRPRGFAEMVGQGHVLRALSNALDAERLHHAYLFTGTRGVGKTTVARILAKCLNCEQGVGSTPCGHCAACTEIDEGRFVDLIEVDAASRTKVDDTRELLENVPYAPTRGRFKIYLIDEVHMFSGHSFNALLKTLEEPPPHVKFLLATTDPQKLPVTILSRCLQFNLRRIPTDQIAGQLAKVTAEEGIESEGPVHNMLALAADGSLRDALSLLDQAIAFGGGRLAEGDVRDMLGTIDQGRVFALVEAVADGDGAALMQRVSELAQQVPDFDSVLAGMASLLQRVAVAQAVPEAVDDELGDRDRLLALAGRMQPEDAQLCYQIAIMGRRDLPLAPDPRVGFDMALLRMLAFKPQTPSEAEAPANGAGGAAPVTRAGARAKAPPRQPPAGEPAPGPAPPAVVGAPKDADWDAIVARLGLSGMTRELAVNSVLRARQGKVFHLLLAADHAHLHSKMREAQLQEALRGYLGGELSLVLDIGEPDRETPSMRRTREDAQRRQAAAEAIEADPNVQSLRETFGADLVEGSVQPIDP